MVKNILKLIVVFIIGTIGGIFADQILWPYFIERPLFYEYRLEKNPIYVTEIKEITIQENEALKNAIEKIEKAIVGVKSETKKGTIYEGAGLIVTADGLVITLAQLVPSGAQVNLYLEGRKIDATVLKQDKDFALLKIEENDLKTVGFFDFRDIRLGERVFFVGTIFDKNDIPQKTVNEGIITSFDQDFVQTNIFEDQDIQGSSLFNIDGQLIGLSKIKKNGKVFAISIERIHSFLGF